MKRIFEVFVGCQVVMSLCQQWIIPSVKNSLIPFSVSIILCFARYFTQDIISWSLFQNMDVAKAIERLLKLAVSLKFILFIFPSLIRNIIASTLNSGRFQIT